MPKYEQTTTESFQVDVLLLPKAIHLIDHYHADGTVTSEDGYTADQVRQAIIADRANRSESQAEPTVQQKRKAYICTSCECVYADQTVSECDCMPDKQEFIEGVIIYPANFSDSEIPAVAMTLARWSLNEFSHEMRCDPNGRYVMLEDVARFAVPLANEEAVAYADPMAFVNFKAAVCTKEWMWSKPDAGLVPLYTRPASSYEFVLKTPSVEGRQNSHTALIAERLLQGHSETIRNMFCDGAPIGRMLIDSVAGTPSGMLEGASQEDPEVLMVNGLLELCRRNANGQYEAIKDTAPIKMPPGWTVALASLKGHQ